MHVFEKDLDSARRDWIIANIASPRRLDPQMLGDRLRDVGASMTSQTPRAPRVLNMSTLGSMPPNAIYVGRPTRWGNPYRIGRDGNRSEVIAKYTAWARARAEDPTFLGALTGRDLVCWCDPLPCHGHVLLRLANDIRAAVTGGRYAPGTRTPNVLSPRQQTELLILLDRGGVGRLAHGAAVGFDRSIALCVTEHRPEIEVTAYPPDPALDGTHLLEALLRRNRRMLKSSRAQILIALPGGGGTANCLSEGMVMGLEVWEWNEAFLRFDRRQ